MRSVGFGLGVSRWKPETVSRPERAIYFPPCVGGFDYWPRLPL